MLSQWHFQSLQTSGSGQFTGGYQRRQKEKGHNLCAYRSSSCKNTPTVDGYLQVGRPSSASSPLRWPRVIPLFRKLRAKTCGLCCWGSSLLRLRNTRSCALFNRSDLRSTSQYPRLCLIDIQPIWSNINFTVLRLTATECWDPIAFCFHLSSL